MPAEVFGDAAFLGDMSATRLAGPVLDSIATPTGRGSHMVASDGGIFAFGDALFEGSLGGKRLVAPVQSLVPDPDGGGYWLVASDGGIFNFSDGIHGIPGRHPSGDAHHVCGRPRRALSRSAEPLQTIDGAPAS